MQETYRKLWSILLPRERKQASILLVLMLGLGALELAGVASIFPLIAVLSNPKVIETNIYLNSFYQTLKFTDMNSFLIFLTGSVFLIIVLRTVYTGLTNYALLRFSEMRSQSFSLRLLSSYLRRPYTYFLNRHSADLGKTVLSEVEQVIYGSLMPSLQVVSKLIIAISLLSLVIVMEPKVALISILVLTVSYSLAYVVIRGYLVRRGAERLEFNRRRYMVAQEVLAGVKEIKVGGLEAGYLRRYDEVSGYFHKLKVRLALTKQIPQMLLQIIAFGGVLTVILTLLFRADGKFHEVLPSVALYAFAGTRILPVVQLLYQSIGSMRVGKPALDALYRELFEADHATDLKTAERNFPLNRELALRNVSFIYPASERSVIKEVSLTIPANSSVGFVGSTGAGKSTVIDLIIGLLESQTGTIEVDGVPITRENARRWQRSIGYVPQQVFIADETIAQNIAFGISSSKVDMASVERAAKMADLHDFIVNDLPEGYVTEVGERGIRLSGGQRQRLGVARALYHSPQVLILDEATSALDNLTEQAVMKAVRSLDHDITIILIAHRLSTVKECDTIFLLEKGELKGQGSFEQLVQTNDRFRAMAVIH
ncbi:ATP-binding cassette domain-containing protein [Vibrio profundum]|uniref:ABC transporter ATP-binding protein n=1 Tax=Vibrio profundum TaxID=2910247 RepID=UPI003D14EED5